MTVEVPSTSKFKTYLAAFAMYVGMGGTALSFVFRERTAIAVAATSVVLMITGGAYLVMRSRSGLLLSWVTYVALVAAGNAVRGIQHHPRPWTLWAIAGATIAAAVAGMVFAIRKARREKELERAISLEGTSLAFFTTMIGAVTYALLEAWVHAPHVSMWWVWGFGMGSWFFYSILLGRRYS